MSIIVVSWNLKPNIHYTPVMSSVVQFLVRDDDKAISQIAQNIGQWRMMKSFKNVKI